MHRRLAWCAFVLAVATLPAAARAEKEFRVHPDFAQRLAGVRKVVVVTPDLKAYELMRNDQPVFHADWTDASRENVAAALEQVFQKRGIATRRLAAGTGTSAALEDVAPMYRAVMEAIIQATYWNDFTAQKDRFEYTLGDLDPLLGDDADAAVFVFGHSASSSGGRKAFQLLLGNGSFALDRLVIAVVAKDGTVLWFEPMSSGAYDLREAGSCAGFVKAALANLPGEKK